MRANASEKPVIGVDIGGTKVSAGLVNSRGEILANSRKPMAPRGSPEEGLRAVTHTIDQLMRDRRAKAARAIGISVPGWVEAARGLLLSATNIPCWRDFPLGREIRKRYGLRTCIANDANAAALAEATWGAGKGYGNVFYVTLGTGIGTGIVMRGRIYEGRTGAAGEGGHVTIDFRGPQCGCGKSGCIEAFASGTAIAKRAQQRLAENDAKDSPILAQADGKIEAVTSEMVSKAAAQGDNLARQVLAEAAERLSIWLGNIIELLEPDVIVIGGGAGRLMISRLGKMEDTLEKWAINPRWREIPIVEAKYGPESAMVGAAALCLPRALTRGSLRKSTS